ncbi:MAG: hypothetical protein IJO09_06530 [Oscillospiraceae bacterium]|nr:hypothetical protein [Oscillospiraceae bacterium]
MTFMQCFIKLLPYAIGLCSLFGIIYPISMIILYKLSGSGISIREILRRI